MNGELDLERLIALLREKGCRKLYVKELAENDNTKNQPYFGSDFETLNILPNQGVRVSNTAGARPNFKANLAFAWMDPRGVLHIASHAKLILYPKYPEVRFSGFLKGCDGAPSALMQPRTPGEPPIPLRLLFLGVRDDGLIVGYLTLATSTMARQFVELRLVNRIGVFTDASSLLTGTLVDSRVVLLQRLHEIHLRQWIDSRRLRADGESVPCSAQNCGGLTLEAEFNILPNALSAPDFMGWELKQHGVPSFENLGARLLTHSKAITLMTPEPTAGYYRTGGVVGFVRRYGHADMHGVVDRMNFSGVYRSGQENPRTRLTLQLLGYDSTSDKMTDVSGGIALISDSGVEAAKWLFADLMNHWNRKHDKTAYVPAIRRNEPCPQYFFGPIVRLGEGTDFLRFLRAVAQGIVYYDPGIHVTNMSTRPVQKRRSQFRIKSNAIAHLYTTLTQEDVSQ